MRPPPFEAPDGSLVTELIRPAADGSRNLSLAEAVVPPGKRTLAHRHRNSEEVYYVLEGVGLLRIEAHQTELRPGQACLIRPGQEHTITCMSASPLRILCVCSPPYQDEDTEVAEGVPV